MSSFSNEGRENPRGGKGSMTSIASLYRIRPTVFSRFEIARLDSSHLAGNLLSAMNHWHARVLLPAGG